MTTARHGEDSNRLPAVYFVAHGLPGYGPEAENAAECETWEGLADTLADELRRDAESEDESAGIHGEAGDYQAAWEAHQRAESLANLAANLDNSRADAPLYRDSRRAWHETIARTVAENFPVDINSSCRLYAWPVEPGTELSCGCRAGDVISAGHRVTCELS